MTSLQEEAIGLYLKVLAGMANPLIHISNEPLGKDEIRDAMSQGVWGTVEVIHSTMEERIGCLEKVVLFLMGHDGVQG